PVLIRIHPLVRALKLQHSIWRQRIHAATSLSLGDEPSFLPEAENRRPHQALVDTELAQDADQVAQPHRSAVWRNCVTEQRNDQRLRFGPRPSPRVLDPLRYG